MYSIFSVCKRKPVVHSIRFASTSNIKKNLELCVEFSLRVLIGDFPNLKQWNSRCLGPAVKFAEQPKDSSIYFLSQSAQYGKRLKK